MRKLFLDICLLLLVLLMPMRSAYAVKRLNFINYRTEHGLSSNFIVNLTTDTHGYLWAATDYGLSRFDGAVFRCFNQDNYVSLYSNEVLQVCACDNGDVTVSGYSGFIQRYDCKADSFVNVVDSNFVQAVGRLYYDRFSGTVYALSSGGLMKMERGASSFSQYEKKNGGSNMQQMFVGKNGYIWMASPLEVLVFNPADKLMLKMTPSSSKMQTFFPQLVSLSDDRMLVCIQDDCFGVFHLTRSGEIEHDYNVKLPFRGLRVIRRAVDGSLWFGSDGEGLWYAPKLPTKTSDIERVAPYGVTDREFSKIYALHADSLGNVWIGTQNTGIWRYIIRDKHASFSSANLGVERCLATSFCEPSPGNIMIGFDGLGVCQFNENNGSTYIYNEHNGLINKNITSLSVDGKGQIWTSTWGGGVYISKNTDKNLSFSSIHFDGIANAQNNVSYCLQLSNGDVWVSVGGDGLYVRKNGKWERARLVYSSGLEEKWPGLSLEGPTGEQWLASSCSMWLQKEGSMIARKPELFVGANGYVVQDMEYIPGYGLILATQKGLMIYNAKSNTFDPVELCYGKDVHSIVKDHQGYLWATVSNNIWRIDLKNKTSVRYPKDFEANGKNFFVNHSKMCSSSGNIYFGTKDGFFCVSGGVLPQSNKSALLCFNGIKVDGQRLKMGNIFSDENKQIQKVCLSYGHSSFSVCIDLVDFSQLRSSLVYRLNNDAWQPVGDQQHISFSYLPTGNYKLEVKQMDAPDEDSISLLIEVEGPWWKSLWFKMLCICLVVLSVGIKLYGINQDRKRLQVMVDERTKELQQKSILVEKRNHDLNKALTTKDRLMTVVAHDLKNPVFAIMGALEGLRRKNEKLGVEERADLLDAMIQRVRILQNELSKLLLWATARQDEQEFIPSNVNLAEVIDSDVELVRMQASEKGVTIHCDVNILNYIYVDSRMLSTAIRNVLGNSLKFTPSGKSIYVRAWQEKSSAFVEIKDEGVGMSAETLQHLLSSNVSASTAGTEGESGTGLGVGLAKYYVNACGGTFEMTSVLDKGTTTLLTLPSTQNALPESVPVQMQTKDLSYVIDSDLMQGNCVLVVDDDPLIAQNVKSMLENYMDVLLASNGREALEVIGQNNVDLVVTDVEMPEMNGIELSNVLASSPATNHIPVLFLSARTSESDRLLGLLTGAVDYIPKPFSQNELLMKLNNILALRQRQQQHLLGKAVGKVSAEKSSEETQFSGQMNPYLTLVLEKIEQNYSNSDYSVEQLASDLCTTRITLYRKVKSLSGQNPSDLLTDYRLNMAQKLLSEGKLSLQDVAEKSGFADYTYFSRKFKTRFGCPPKDYNAF